jgi:hypothetical protein
MARRAGPEGPITAAGQLAASLPYCQARFGPGGYLMAGDHDGDVLTVLTSAC